MRHRHVWIAAIVLCTAMTAASAAPYGNFDVAGFAGWSPAEQMRNVEDPSFWASFSKECGEARAIVGGNSESKPAKERYAAAVAYKRCLEELRAVVAGEASKQRNPQILPQLDASLRAEEERAEQWIKQTGAEDTFGSLRFGVGVGVSYAFDTIVSEAVVGPGNVVRPTKTDTQIPRVILESHYYGWCRSAACNAGRFGVGPYFGIVAKSEKLISAFSAGVMLGWKDKKAGDPQGFSMGIGALLDDAVKSLADGFEADQPLPPGEGDIRYETKARWSAILFFTRTF